MIILLHGGSLESIGGGNIHKVLQPIAGNQISFKELLVEIKLSGTDLVLLQLFKISPDTDLGIVPQSTWVL